MAITYRPCSKYLPVCVRWVSAITSPFCSTITSRTLLPPTTPTPPSTPLSQSQSQYSLPYTATSKVLVTLSTIPQTVPTKSLTSPAPSTTPPPLCISFPAPPKENLRCLSKCWPRYQYFQRDLLSPDGTSTDRRPSWEITASANWIKHGNQRVYIS